MNTLIRPRNTQYLDFWIRNVHFPHVHVGSCDTDSFRLKTPNSFWPVASESFSESFYECWVFAQWVCLFQFLKKLHLPVSFWELSPHCAASSLLKLITWKSRCMFLKCAVIYRNRTGWMSGSLSLIHTCFLCVLLLRVNWVWVSSSLYFCLFVI